MAEEIYDDDVALEAEADNAKDLTSWLVIATTVMLLLAFFAMQMALGHWYNIGLFGGK